MNWKTKIYDWYSDYFGTDSKPKRIIEKQYLDDNGFKRLRIGFLLKSGKYIERTQKIPSEPPELIPGVIKSITETVADQSPESRWLYIKQEREEIDELFVNTEEVASIDFEVIPWIIKYN